MTEIENGKDDIEIVNSDIFQNFRILGIEKWDVTRRECKAEEVSFLKNFLIFTIRDNSLINIHVPTTQL